MAKLKATPKSYADALDVFNKAYASGTRRAGQCSIRLGNNTYLESYTDGTKIDRFCVRLHDTNIVEFYYDGRIVLHTQSPSGLLWRTVTTKQRLNAFIHGRIHQDAGRWYYSTLNPDGSVYAQREFHEGLIA